MISQSTLLSVFALLLLPLSKAHYEHRDLSNIYYGPDSSNTDFLPVPLESAGLPVDPKTGYYLEHLGYGTYFMFDVR